MIAYFLRICILITALVNLSGCDNAYFTNSRQIVGDFYLEQWEDFQTYYIEDKMQSPVNHLGGAVDGIVKAIGWNKNFILLYRQGVAGPDGWIVINVQSRTISGPFLNAEVSAMNELTEIKVISASAAWDLLCDRQIICW
jgi:hypothetical protein